MREREIMIPVEIAAKLIGRSPERLREEGWLPTLTVDGRTLYPMNMLVSIFGLRGSAIDVRRAELDGYTL